MCPECDDANTFQKFMPQAERQGRVAVTDSNAPAADFTPLKDISKQTFKRTKTGISELDRVLGEGMVPGSYIVLSGAPGAGKSTLATEWLLNLDNNNHSVAYVSGEESPAQIRMRFNRLGAKEDNKILVSSETSIERICQSIYKMAPTLIVIDSIQTMISEEVSSAAGSLAQVRECAQKLMKAAKTTKTSVLLIGQVVKSGEMAGPRALEHLVDVVLAFEGDQREQHRILRSVKNRFGSTDEIGVFEMTGSGLVGVDDPSTMFVDNKKPLPGSAITAVMEGSRPMICEIQALTSSSNLPQPIRAVRGLDPKRVQMLLAVLSRKAGFHLGSYDVYVNVSGGLKIDDPGTDLAVCLAVASAIEGVAIKERYCAFGEISLLGLTRPANQSERRIKEAQRLGFTPHYPDRSQNAANLIKDAFGQAVEESLENSSL
jgi:DNA repair protein RadA/Sms